MQEDFNFSVFSWKHKDGGNENDVKIILNGVYVMGKYGEEMIEGHLTFRKINEGTGIIFTPDQEPFKEPFPFSVPLKLKRKEISLGFYDLPEDQKRRHLEDIHNIKNVLMNLFGMKQDQFWTNSI